MKRWIVWYYGWGSLFTVSCGPVLINGVHDWHLINVEFILSVSSVKTYILSDNTIMSLIENVLDTRLMTSCLCLLFLKNHRSTMFTRTEIFRAVCTPIAGMARTTTLTELISFWRNERASIKTIKTRMIATLIFEQTASKI